MDYKVLLLTLLACVIWLMYETILAARRIPQAGPDPDLRNEAIEAHQLYSLWLLFLTFLFIVFVEGKRFFFGSVTRDWLFYTHLPFAVSFFGSLIAIVARFNGRRFVHHRRLGYLTIALFIPTVLTGIPMIIRMAD